MTLVLGGTCRILQYYLRVPTAQIRCDAEGFLNGSDIAGYLGQHDVRYVIVEETHQRDDLLAGHGLRLLFKSARGLGATRFVVYSRS